MPLHIFEPRYRRLIRRCMERHHPFGIDLIRSGSEVDPRAEPYDVGTEAKIVAESPLPDGRSYIVTRGERRFAVENLIPDAEPYLVGQVRYLDEADGDVAASHASVALEELGSYLLAVVAVTDASRGERALGDDRRRSRRSACPPRAFRTRAPGPWNKRRPRYTRAAPRPK